MSDVVPTLRLAERIDQFAAGFPETLDCSVRCFSQERLELREYCLDGIEIGAVRWQVSNFCSDSFDGLTHSYDFVRAEIVHHDDVVFAQRGHKLLLNVSEENRAVDRAIHNQGGCQPGAPKCRHERRRFPVSMRHASHQTRSFERTSSRSRHVGFGPCFIDKNQMLWVQV